MNIEGILKLRSLNANAARLSLMSDIREQEQIDRDIALEERIIEEAQERLGKYSFFGKIFRREEYLRDKRQSERQILYANGKLVSLFDRRKDIGALQDQLTTLDSNVQDVIAEYNIPKFVVKNINAFSVTENGQLVVNPELIEMDTPTEVKMKSVADSQIATVHKTSKFPTSGRVVTNREGRKTLDKYSVHSIGGCFVSRGKSCRNTIHHTLNRVVSGEHGMGDWSKDCICVIEEYSEHKDEFACDDPADAYTRDSVDLSGKHLVLVSQEVYEGLSKEEKKNPRVVVVDAKTPEEFDKGVMAMLMSCDRPIIKGDINSAGHANSVDMKYEDVWEKAAVAFSLLGDKNNIFENNLTISSSDISKFAYIMSKMSSDYVTRNTFCEQVIIKDDKDEKVGVSSQLITAFLYGGLRKNDDGSYTRTDDYDELTKRLEEIKYDYSESREEKIADFVRSNGLIELQKEIDSIQAMFDNMPTPTKEEVLGMNIESLTKFESLKSLGVVTSIFNEQAKNIYNFDRSFRISPDGFVVRANTQFGMNGEENRKRTYIPNDSITPINNEEYVIPLSEAKTLGEALERQKSIEIGFVDELTM